MRLIIFLLLSVFSLLSVAQQSSVESIFKVDYDTPLTIDLQERKEETDPADVQPVKKKKVNKKVFFGIKTKRGFTKTGFGKNTVAELFHFLKPKDVVMPDTYDRDFYFYDFKKKKIVNSLKFDPKRGGVMHGHYVKKIGEQVLEEGYFYKGKKHGRWVRLNKSDILMDKKVYWKGWPEESRMRFYDHDREQLKEVVPVHFGEKNGTYYAFFPNGQIAAIGNYEFDEKIGLWREFYDNRRIKREIQYPEKPFEKGVVPHILREYDKSGLLIYSREKFLNGVD